MTSEDLAWAEAIALYRTHGNRIYRMVAERIGTLAAEGDADGVERCKAIAEQIDQLLRAGGSA